MPCCPASPSRRRARCSSRRRASVVTDETGGYRLVDLRPGVYTLTFTLEGFSTVKREGLELPSNFTMTVNADLKVGSLEETLTVTGASPTVDVQSTTKSQVLNREALDAIPTGRTIQGMGQLITGVSLNIPDVGGSRAMQQTYMSTHGLGASQTTVQVDGLLVNGLDGDGAVQNYFNSSMSQEMVYTTSGAGGRRVGRRRAAEHDSARRRQQVQRQPSSPAIRTRASSPTT